MAIKLNCPRCKRPLSAPNKKAGSYARCPSCNGQFWVPQDAPSDASQVDTVMALTGPAPAAAGMAPTTAMPSVGGPAAAPAAPGAPVAAPGTSSSPRLPSPLPPPAPPNWTPPAPRTAPGAPAPAGAGPGSIPLPSAPASVPPAPMATLAAPQLPPAGVAMVPPGPPIAPPAPAAPVAPPPARRTARLITAEAAQSPLTLAADGKLPELHLQESESKKAEKGASALNPLVLLGLLVFSVGLSIAMVLMDSGGPAPKRVEERARARQFLETEGYLGTGTLDRGKALEPYQNELREARSEYVRGNYRAERKRYQKVLDMLRANRSGAERGLTGSRKRDKDLEEQLLILLSEG